MPFTPFHFGPGSLLHSLVKSHVSFISFCMANVLTDIEPLYFMVTGQFPIHRFCHTYVGATVVAAATILLFVVARRFSAAFWLPNILNWKGLNIRQVAIGAALGTYTHIVLDSIMHSDVRPYFPFSSANQLYGAIDLPMLHLLCFGAALLGVLGVAIRHLSR